MSALGFDCHGHNALRLTSPAKAHESAPRMTAAATAQGSFVRLAGVQDLDAMAEILSGDRHTSWDRSAVAKELSVAWSRVHVLVNDGGLLGLVVHWLVADEIQILHIATHAAHRRRGVARTLLTSVEREARHRNSRRIVLEVRRDNPSARGLYAAAGFVETGARSRYYPDGEDAVLMSREVR